jgi:hypothetical protein
MEIGVFVEYYSNRTETGLQQVVVIMDIRQVVEVWHVQS